MPKQKSQRFKIKALPSRHETLVNLFFFVAVLCHRAALWASMGSARIQ